MQFTHLHVHSHYSLLDGMSKVGDLIAKCLKNGMSSIALTDHGNMFGIKELVDSSLKHNSGVDKKIKALTKELKEKGANNPDTKLEIENQIEFHKTQYFKPIIGVEAYCARRTLYDHNKDVKITNPENGRQVVVDRGGYHLVLLAKNPTGYHNLCKLISIAWMDGMYGRPRIDKNILEKYHEGIIVSSACLGGEIPQLILANKIDEARKSIQWFKSIFKEDYYLEIQRHQTEKPNAEVRTYQVQKRVNPVILQLAEETNTKVIATNDVHFVEEEHAEAHDRLICLSTGKDVDDPNRMHYTKQEWLKTPEEMHAIFKDVPEALSNTQEIVDKVEIYSLDSPPIMPKYDIPEAFGTEDSYRKQYSNEDLFEEFTRDETGQEVLSREDAESKIKKIGGYDKLYRIKLEADYLAKLAWEGAKIRYGEILSDEIKERIIFELHIMKTMGFPGYFLIVQDFIAAARDMGVSVGPGRGSAAGSVVAYCLKITDIDPLKYDLLFERFLNPDRISLPDIDVDFDDDGRSDVLHWVTDKYGKEKVAHIVTYGTMATKSSIKDVGRVQKVPLPKVNEIVSYIPDKMPDTAKDAKGKTLKVKIKNCLKYVPEIKQAHLGTDSNVSSMLTYANELEDTIRQIGIHACGVIIGADDLTNFAPLATVKDKASGEDILVTQYDGHVVESVGLIKMDFLGLKTLSIIKEALRNIKKSKDVDINIDTIPIDDKLTYQLYSEGKTIGTFQFESPGMQKYLRELKPSVFEDLIAMNALYRPGPMKYIPQFINRKHGLEPISYDIDIMEKYLKDTYGITVYQEQVMLLSRLLANFTRGESDALRKAMGKKLIHVLNSLKPKFINGGISNGHDPKVLEKIWEDWEDFASYAFNKSHATCYSWISYQTAYLKAHYPAEFMAANLTRNRDNIADVTKFMDECKAMRLPVKGPDVNESDLNFMVNKTGEIRFGLGGIKGVGQGAVEAIVKEREEHGPYKDIYDFMERVNLTACNKKTCENLALSGAFDSMLPVTRETYLGTGEKGDTFLQELLSYGNRYQMDQQQNQASLFDMLDEEIEIAKPQAPETPEWSTLNRLNKEKELIGIYLSSHPLDRYAIEIKHGCNTKLNEIEELLASKKKHKFTCGGMVIAHRTGITKRDKQFGIITVEDYSGQFSFPLFGDDYINYSKYLKDDLMILIKGEIIEYGSNWKFKKQSDPNEPIRMTTCISSIELLENVGNSLIKGLNLSIDLNQMNKIDYEDLFTLFSENKGRNELSIDVEDPHSNKIISLHTNKYPISINNKVVNYLDSLVDDNKASYKIF